jgi:SAM-dependent methyltransferase
MEEQYYDEYARLQDRHWWFSGRRRVIAAVLDDGLAPAPAERRILDVGCGTGAMLAELRRYGSAQGVDSEQKAIDVCHERGETAVLRASGTDLPFADASFDLVTLLDVVEHERDEAGMLDEARRVVEPAGAVLVTVPAYEFLWGEHDEVNHHWRRYTRPRLVSALERSGLEVERATYFNTLLFPPIAGVRLAQRLRPRKGPPRPDTQLSESGFVNSTLSRVFGSEAGLIGRGARMPFGVSVLALARPS